jgi:predicted transcriptional regulator
MEILKINQWQKVLGYLFNNRSVSITDINRAIIGTYSHTIKLIYYLEKVGLIKKDRKGRIDVVSLTDKGLKFAIACDETIKLIKDCEVKKDENI